VRREAAELASHGLTVVNCGLDLCLSTNQSLSIIVALSGDAASLPVIVFNWYQILAEYQTKIMHKDC